ncbi:hypothetical protein LCGC14_0282320 [marine sediment metagenome]|uniref:HTH cro/C1-type domain-containing protein n=1 Tax=marine sediment metagenome TaxID=412755 RepID=A0A0F9X0X8_9ZZZZ
MNIEAMADKEIAAAVGDAIKAHRASKGLTQEEVAIEVGVSIPTLIAAEGGKVKLEVLIGILRALGNLSLAAALMEPPLPSPAIAVQSTKPKAQPKARARSRKDD